MDEQHLGTMIVEDGAGSMLFWEGEKYSECRRVLWFGVCFSFHAAFKPTNHKLVVLTGKLSGV